MRSPDGSRHDDPAATRRHRRRAVLLLAAAAWNLWLWTTRIYNLVADEVPRSAGFITVHAVLYGVSLAFTAAFAVVGLRMWREARRGGDDPPAGSGGVPDPARTRALTASGGGQAPASPSAP